MRVFYYGCWREPGHYLWQPGPIIVRGGEQEAALLGISRHNRGGPTKGEIPWGYALDGGLLRRLPTYENGVAIIAHLGGWTALSFWDNSVDDRPGSCSSFVMDEMLDDVSARVAAERAFPDVFARFTFEVKPA